MGKHSRTARLMAERLEDRLTPASSRLQDHRFDELPRGGRTIGLDLRIVGLRPPGYESTASRLGS